jgi:hypothetical protein
MKQGRSLRLDLQSGSGSKTPPVQKNLAGGVHQQP